MKNKVLAFVTAILLSGCMIAQGTLPSGGVNGQYLQKGTGTNYKWANGTSGVTGATGATGANGSNGVTGATGMAGSDGFDGAIGATGGVGPTGSTGSNGATGAAGSNGTVGLTGATGATGITGSTGLIGSTGSAGSNGATGATGSAGTNGTNGINGATGATGATGSITALAGTPTYITLSGSTITRGQVTLTTDVTGVLPLANGGNNHGYGAGYRIDAGLAATLISPADATSYFFQPYSVNSTNTGSTRGRIYITKSGIIEAFYGNAQINSVGSGETSSVFITVNGGAATTIISAQAIGASSTQYSNTSLSIAVNAGDYINCYWTTATWATNPIGLTFNITLGIR